MKSIEVPEVEACSVARVKILSVPLVGSVTFVAPVLVNVIELAPLVTSELPSARVNVALAAGAVIVTLLTVLCAVIAPAIFASPPTHRAFVTPRPPAVLREPVEMELLSKVPGMATLAVAPVPPMVSRVVAPAKAVKVVLAVVKLVVKAGEVALTVPENDQVPSSVAVPLAWPMLSATEAAPKALIVVAVVLNTAKVVEVVVTPVMNGIAAVAV